MKARIGGAFVGLVLVSSTLIASPAGAAANVQIKMGAGLGKTVPGFTTRIMAPHEAGQPVVHVHQNDVIDFRGIAILLPVGQEPQSWWQANGNTIDSPFNFFMSDPDGDIPGVNAPTKANLALFSGNVSDCGETAESPCSYDGSNPDPVEGALYPPDTFPHFFVQITAAPGTTIWAFDNFNPQPQSSLMIEVVEEAEAATTQAEVDAAFTQYKAEDKQAALDAIEELSEVTREPAGNNFIYDAYVGYDDGAVVLFTMLPANLKVHKGDTVRYHFPLVNEMHTATFPFKKAKTASFESFVPACDPDGEGDGPDTMPPFATGPPACPDEMGELEFDLSSKMTAEKGDGVFPGGYENSGLRGPWVPSAPGLAGGTEDWDLKFTERSGDAPYKYMCVLHGSFMQGAVEVI